MAGDFDPWQAAAEDAAAAAGRAVTSNLPQRPAAAETGDQPPPDESGMAPPEETVPPEQKQTEGDYDPAEGRDGWVKSQGNRPRDNGKYDAFVPQSSDDARWAAAFAHEHNNQGPKYEDYYDRLWSIGFARQQDRSPTLNDWRTHYYVKYDDNEPDRAVNRVRYETRDFEWEPAQPLAVYTDKHGPWDVDRPKAKEKAATTGAGGNAGGAGGGGGGAAKGMTAEQARQRAINTGQWKTGLTEPWQPETQAPARNPFAGTPGIDMAPERQETRYSGRQPSAVDLGLAPPSSGLPYAGVPFSVLRGSGMDVPGSYDPRSGRPAPEGAFGPWNYGEPTFSEYMAGPTPYRGRTEPWQPETAPVAPDSAIVRYQNGQRSYTPTPSLADSAGALRDQLIRNLFGR